MADIFVFGSNLAGRHGAGSAKEARQSWGAIQGQGVGPQGNAYAIPTKNEYLRKLSLPKIKEYVDDFLQYARNHPVDDFYVVNIGCGLAGYQVFQIAPMFGKAPFNVKLTKGFEEYLNRIGIKRG